MEFCKILVPSSDLNKFNLGLIVFEDNEVKQAIEVTTGRWIVESKFLTSFGNTIQKFESKTDELIAISKVFTGSIFIARFEIVNVIESLITFNLFQNSLAMSVIRLIESDLSKDEFKFGESVFVCNKKLFIPNKQLNITRENAINYPLSCSHKIVDLKIDTYVLYRYIEKLSISEEPKFIKMESEDLCKRYFEEMSKQR